MDIPEVLITYIGHLAMGVTQGLKVFGVCWKDKYCWTNVFGFENLNK